MGEIKSFFFDTYAFYEIVHGNINYKTYEKNVNILTSKLNLMELHYILLRTYNANVAETAFNKFLEFCIEIDDETIKEANKFRLKNYKRSLSYVDCIGYILAKKFNAKFLSGDIQFKDFENVEFVK